MHYPLRDQVEELSEKIGKVVDSTDSIHERECCRIAWQKLREAIVHLERYCGMTPETSRAVKGGAR